MKILSPAVLTLLCLLSIPASAAVTIVSGNVYDNGKYSYRTENGLPAPYSDSAMCWAAAASNVIQYWQDTYGGFAAAGTPTGINTTAYAQPQGTGSLNVYNTFLQNWTNSSGHPYNGISWWMQGGLYDSNSASKPADGTGGYYTAVFGTEHPDHASDDPLKNASFYDYYLDKGAKEQHYTRPGLAEMKATLQKAFATQGQAVALGLFSEKTYYSHSITCWGYETDDEGNITSLIVSDSDDKKYGTTLLNLTEGVGADGKVRTYISTDRRNGFAADTACYINQVTYINTPTITADGSRQVAQVADQSSALASLGSRIDASARITQNLTAGHAVTIQGARDAGSGVPAAIVVTSEQGALLSIEGVYSTTAPLLTVGDGAMALLYGGLSVKGPGGGVKADGHLYVHGGNVSITDCTSATSGGGLYASDLEARVDSGRISNAQTYAEFRGAGNINLSRNSSRTSRKETYYLYNAGGGAVAAEDSFNIIDCGTVTLNNNCAVGLNVNGGAVYAQFNLGISGNAGVSMQENEVHATGCDSYGGAAAGMFVDVSGNGAVEISGNSISIDNTSERTCTNVYVCGARAGGGGLAARFFTTLSIWDPKTGAFIYTPAELAVDANASVLFRGNSVSSTFRGYNAVNADESCAAHGGAIMLDSVSTYSSGNIGAVGSVSRTAGDVVFNANSVHSESVQRKNDTARGGAVYIGAAASMVMEANAGCVSFTENKATGTTAQGGAVYNEGTFRLSGNRSVEFSGNSAAEGNDLYNAVDCTAELAWNGTFVIDDTGKKGDAVVNKGTLYMAAEQGHTMEFVNAKLNSAEGTLILGEDAAGKLGNGALRFTDGGSTYMQMSLPENVSATLEHISLSLGTMMGGGADTELNHIAVAANTNLAVSNLRMGADTSLSVGNNTITLTNVTIDLSGVSHSTETLAGGTLYRFDLRHMINCALTMEDVTFDATGVSGFSVGDNVAVAMDFGQDVTFSGETVSTLKMAEGVHTEITARDGMVFFGDTAIPEPSTATLSLLALAALLQRRKRR